MRDIVSLLCLQENFHSLYFLSLAFLNAAYDINERCGSVQLCWHLSPSPLAFSRSTLLRRFPACSESILSPPLAPMRYTILISHAPDPATKTTAN